MIYITCPYYFIVVHNGIQSNKTSARLKGKPPYSMHFGNHLSTAPSLINARSVSLLQCRLGDDCWHVVKEFTVNDIFSLTDNEY